MGFDEQGWSIGPKSGTVNGIAEFWNVNGFSVGGHAGLHGLLSESTAAGQMAELFDLTFPVSVVAVHVALCWCGSGTVKIDES
jgi:hypothetical protein